MRLFLLLCTCVLAQTISAQTLTRSVIGSAGTYAEAENSINIHWTLGEVAVDRTQNGITLERGFHQGHAALVSTSAWTAPEVQINVTAFPNPTVDHITLTGDWQQGDQLIVHDLLGRKMSAQQLAPARTELRLGQFPQGTYLLSIVRRGMPVKSMRIIRN